MSGIITVNGDLTINASSSLDVTTSNRAINIKGNWINNGTFTPRSGIVTFNGTTQSITSTVTPTPVTTTFNKLTIANGSTTTGTVNPTISGTGNLFSINSGGKFIQTGGSGIPGTSQNFVSGSVYELQAPITLASATAFGNLIINFSGSTSTQFAGNVTSILNDLDVKNTGTGVLRFAASQNPTIAVVGKLIISGGAVEASSSTGVPIINVTGNFEQSGGTFKLSTSSTGGQQLNVTGDVKLSSGTFQPMSSTGVPSISVKGNWTNNGGTFTPGSTTVTFNNTSIDQNINGTSISQTFYGLTLAKSAKNLLISGSTTNVTVSSTLTMTSGNIDCGTNNLFVSNNAASAISYTAGRVIGNLQRAIATGNNTYAFPIGTSSGYTPISLAFTDVNTGGNLTVKSTDGVSANYPTALSATKKLARSWLITNGGIGTFTASATCTYLPADLIGGAVAANLKAYKFDAPSTYTYPTTATGTLSFTAGGIQSFSELGAGESGCAVTASITAQTNVACFGNSTGSVTVAGANGTSGYTYSKDAGTTYQASGTFGSLAVGPYTITVKDANGCTTTQAVTITQPTAALTASITAQTNVACFGNSTGSVTVAGANGTSGYTYSKDAGTTYQASGTFGSLAAGPYTITVKDANGCTTTQAVTITQPSAIGGSITSQTNIQCTGANSGAVTVVGNGGTTPYEYKLGTGVYQSNGTFSGLAAGPYTIAVKDANGCTNSVNVTITKFATNASLVVTPTTRQYSDIVEFKAVITPTAGYEATCIAAEKVRFKVGTEVMGEANFTFNNSTNKFEAVLNKALLEYAIAGSMNPNTGSPIGNKTVTAELINISPAYAVTNPSSTSLTITPEDARATYTGALFVSTSGSTSSTATVNLRANIQDITAVTGDPAYDAYAGDIRNARVTFKVLNQGGGTVYTSAELTPVLLLPGDSKTGTVTVDWTANIGTSDAESYTVRIIVNNYYTRESSEDNAVVTIAKPVSGMITGGGYVILKNSAGQKAGTEGTKNNFGFNVKNDKNGAPKGTINTIIRRLETSDNKVHVYQIKGNAMTSLALTYATASTPGKATFNGKANIQDITDPLAPISVDGNATLQVTMTDMGEPGNYDRIAVTVWEKTGSLWFANYWDVASAKTLEQQLDGGNLKVHGAGTFTTGSSQPTVTLTSSANPSVAGNPVNFTVAVSGSTTPTGQVTLYDYTTNKTYTSKTLSSGTATFTIPAADLTPGPHTIVVYYGGDSKYSSGSSSLVQLVNASAPITQLGGVEKNGIQEEVVATKFNMKAFPNPTTNHFNIQLQSDNMKEKINLRVSDLAGRTVELLWNISAGQTVQIGSKYRPGMYIVEMIQGNNRKQLKLIKQPD